MKYILLITLLLFPISVHASQFEFLLNKYREANNVHELVQSDYMNEWAEDRACWVADNREKVLDYYEKTGKHLGFNGLVKEKEIRGENIAFDYVDELNILRAWIASKTHNDNLLENRYLAFGIGKCNEVTVILFD